MTDQRRVSLVDHLSLRVGTGLLVLALLATACSDDSGGDAAVSETTSTTTTTEAPAPTSTTNSTTTTTIPLVRGSSGCGPDRAASGAQETALTATDGRVRTFRMFVPAGYDSMAATPLVLNFHGLTSNIEQQVELSRLEPLADEETFIVITPQGTENENGVPFWNASPGSSETVVDDAQFVGELLDQVESDLCVDLDRVFSTGMSNGGFMSSHLACVMAARIAAVATVTGITGNNDCDPIAVPVVHFHGTADGIVRYDNIPDRVSGWAAANGCDEGPTETEITAEVTHDIWSCPEGAEVEFYTVIGGGHTWPGTPLPEPMATLLGYTTVDIDATAIAWEWFKAHPKSNT